MKSLIVAALLSAAPAAAQTDPAIAAMTLDEKVAQLKSGAPAIPALDLSAYDYWNEGLHGLARNGIATVFPQAIALAATWDTALVERVGDVVSTEARAKYNALPKGNRKRYQGLTIWSPNINIFRDPRWGRGQETYGEDPYLTGRMAVAFVRGLQGPDPIHPKVIATPKHLAAHSGPEAGRDSFDVDISPYDREATYLPAFRMALTEGKARSVMCAYNSIHGVPVCASDALLDGTLRRDWGWRGVIVSDCDAIGNIATYHHYRPDAAGAAAAAIAAGMDLNCGRTYAALGDAVRRGLVPEAMIDASLSRVFAARRALGGAFGATSPWDRIAPTEIDTPAHRALALAAAREAMVLVANNGVLPLKPGARIAVIGPNSDSLDVLEANYHGTAAAPVTPLAALRQAFVGVRHAQGSMIADGVPVPVPDTALNVSGAYFRGPDFAGTPALVRIDRKIDFDWDRVAPAAGIDPASWSVRWTGTLTAPAAGNYVLRLDVPRCFDCKGHDPSRLWIDGKPVVDDDGGGTKVEAALTLAAGAHDIRIELAHRGEDQGLRLTWTAPPAAQIAEAVAAAQDADAIVAFVGLSPAVEGEALGIEVPGFSGGDRTDIGLPAAQLRLLEAAKATGKPLVVVLMSGSAVALQWAKDRADALLIGWYPGQAGGEAIAETLTGANNPAGRLPVTFYARTRDLPAFIDYNMRERTYRYFTGTPLWRFGHGLSYTSFTYAPLAPPRTVAAGDTLTIAAFVTNRGKRAGDEVVQAYLVPPVPTPKPGYNDPVLQRQLVAFRRETLTPGQTKRVTLTIDARAMSSVDAAGNRRVVPGEYRLHVGGGQPGDGAGVETRFTVAGMKDLPR